MSLILRGWIRTAGLALAVAVAGGCAPARTWLRPPCLEPAPAVEALVAPLRERARPVDTLWLRARVVARRQLRPGVQHFDATLLADVPDRLRLRAYRNATILVFDALADEQGLRLRDAMNKRYYAGTYDELARARSPWAGLRPSFLLQGLLVEQSIVEWMAEAESATARRRWRGIELRLEVPDGRLRIRFDRAGREIVDVIHEPAAGGKASRLRYGPMFEVENVRLPAWIEIRHGPSRTRTRIELFRDPDNSEMAPKINPRLQERVFTLRPPAGQPWLPLTTLK